MLVSAVLTSSFLALNSGDVCDWTSAAVRVYQVAQNAILQSCTKPDEMNAGTNQGQREFLIQHLPSVLTSQGFRTTLSPLYGKTAIFARIAATEDYEISPLSLMPNHQRYYTKLRDDQSEVLLTVIGNLETGHTLTASHHYSVDGVRFSTYDTRTLLPSDFSSPAALELDTRVNSDNQFGARGSIRIQVCARRGAGACHNFQFYNRFGSSAAAEFYLGSALIGLDSPVRYCNLPAFGVQHASGYTSVCPGPSVPTVTHQFSD